MEMRINKFLASSGIGSRRGVEKYIEQGDVKVNGQVVKDLATKIDPQKDIVMYKNKVVIPEQKYVYYLLNKPSGYVTTTNDEKSRKKVTDLIQDTEFRIYPVGRLDYETEGLLFLTNDGELTNKLTDPKRFVEKKYLVKINSRLDDEDISLIKQGVTLNDGYKTRPAKIRIINNKKNISKIELTLTEGKNRQIRRMIEALEKKVIYLKRIEMANIKLGSLDVGEYRHLNNNEIKTLKNIK